MKNANKKYKRYPEYKPSGVDWLGKVPAHWRTDRLKHQSKLIANKAYDDKYPIMALENIQSWTGQTVETEADYQSEGVLCDKNDILFGKLRPYLAKVYKCHKPLIAIGDLLVYRAWKTTHPDFLFHTMVMEGFISVVDSSTYGAKMPRASSEFISNIIIPVPPLPEQRAIATFLDRETGKIDRMVERQERMIELLQEKRQAVISHAVTKGLDPDAPMKDSGVEWLGEIPAHWEVLKVRDVARVINGYPFDSNLFSNTSGFPLIRIRDLNKAKTATSYQGSFVEAARVEQGDVLVGMDGDFNVGRWLGAEPALLNQRMCCVRVQEEITENLLAYVLPRPLRQINEVTWSTTVKHLKSSQVERIPFGLPPLPEQAAIVEFLDRETTKTDNLIAKAERAIELMKERRTALISAAVTGKIDVRGQGRGRPRPHLGGIEK